MNKFASYIIFFVFLLDCPWKSLIYNIFKYTYIHARGLIMREFLGNLCVFLPDKKSLDTKKKMTFFSINLKENNENVTFWLIRDSFVLLIVIKNIKIIIQNN